MHIYILYLQLLLGSKVFSIYKLILLRKWILVWCLFEFVGNVVIGGPCRWRYPVQMFETVWSEYFRGSCCPETTRSSVNAWSARSQIGMVILSLVEVVFIEFVLSIGVCVFWSYYPRYLMLWYAFWPLLCWKDLFLIDFTYLFFKLNFLS